MSDDAKTTQPTAPARENIRVEDDVIRIEDLAPPEDVRGGRKILLGEVLTPPGVPSIGGES